MTLFIFLFRANIELVFNESLIDSNASKPIKMINLLKLTCFCRDECIPTIAKIFHNQFKLRFLVQKFIHCFENSGNENNSLETKRNIEELCKYFCYIDNIENMVICFQRALKHNPEKLLILKQLFTSSLTQNEQILEKMEQLYINEELHEFIHHMLGRSGIQIFDSQTFGVLFHEIRNFEAGHALRIASLLTLLSNVFRENFIEETVTSALLRLPPIILKVLALDSHLPHLRCPQTTKDQIKSIANQSSDTLNRQDSQLNV